MSMQLPRWYHYLEPAIFLSRCMILLLLHAINQTSQSCCHAPYTVICNVWYSSNCQIVLCHARNTKILNQNDVIRRSVQKKVKRPAVRCQKLSPVLPSCVLPLSYNKWTTTIATQSLTCTAQVILNAPVTCTPAWYLQKSSTRKFSSSANAEKLLGL